MTLKPAFRDHACDMAVCVLSNVWMYSTWYGAVGLNACPHVCAWSSGLIYMPTHVCVKLWTYMYVHTHVWSCGITCISACVCMELWAYMHVQICGLTCMFTHVCSCIQLCSARACMNVHVPVGVCVCVCLCVRPHVSTYVCVHSCTHLPALLCTQAGLYVWCV